MIEPMLPLILLHRGKGIGGALWNMVDTFVYVCIFVCMCARSHVNIHTPVCVEAKGKSQVSSSGMSSPYFETGSLLGLELTS